MSIVRLLASTWLYYLATCGFLASAIYLFAKAPTYGSQPECNKTVIFVIFGVNIHATSAIFRWIMVASLSCVLLGTVVYCIVVSCMCLHGREISSGSAEDSEDRPQKGFPYHLIGRLGGSAYIIAMLELIIKRNSVSPQERVWTFGQVLAVVMLVGPLIEILSLILGRAGVDHRLA